MIEIRNEEKIKGLKKNKEKKYDIQKEKCN